MSHDPSPAPPDLERLCHALNTHLTVLQGRAQLLQRRLDRRDRLSTADRAWLAEGLAGMVVTSQALASVIARSLPRQAPERRPGPSPPADTGLSHGGNAMPHRQLTATGLNEAIAGVEQARKALGTVPHHGEESVIIDGIAFMLRDLQARLRALRDRTATNGPGAASTVPPSAPAG